MKRRVYTRMEVLVGIDCDCDSDEDELLKNAAEALGRIRPREGLQSFTSWRASPTIFFEDAQGRPAEVIISIPMDLDIDTDKLEIEKL